jgi:hypothetical protein
MGIWLALFFSVLATVAHAEVTWNQMGDDAGPARRVGRKLASSHDGDFDFTLVDISSTISYDWKFSGAAAASNGKIVFGPLDADGVGVFDPSDNSFELVDISSTISMGTKFSGAAAASNGKVVLGPRNADGVGVFEFLSCVKDHRVLNGACVPCGSGASRAQGDHIDGGDTECACVKDHRVLNGACVACDPGVGRAPGDVLSGGDTECEFCVSDHRVASGACVPCSEGNVRAEGDDPRGGDTACSCSCKDRFRGNGMKLKDLAFFNRSSRFAATTELRKRR